MDKSQAMQAILNDEALYKELLNDFAALNKELDNLRKAIDEKDYASIVRIAHIYITALRYIGAYALAELAATIELTVKRNEHGSVAGFSDQLEALYTALVEMNAKVEGMVK